MGVRFTASLIAAGLALLGGSPGNQLAGQEAAASPSATSGSPAEAASPTPAQLKLGEKVFKVKGNCTYCHGNRAEGSASGPSLKDGEWLHTGGTLAGITEVIANGVPEPKQYAMPMRPKGGANLSPAEIEAVAAYVHSLGQQ